jgi:hypothetical protein
LGKIAGHPGDRMRKRPCNSGESGVEIAVIMEEDAFLATRMIGDDGRSGSRTN